MSFTFAPLAYAIGFGLIVGANLTYLIAAYYQQVPWCVPYWDSCTSISAAGRQAPAYFVFKAIMLPLAGLMLVYWPLLDVWLARLQPGAVLRRTLSYLGVFAALALALYATMLGAVGQLYQLQRRIGIILFFGCTALAHLWMVYRLSQLPKAHRPEIYLVQCALSIVLLCGGLMNSVLALSLDNFDEIEDAMEWCFALVMASQFVVTGYGWKQTQFGLSH